jgi:N-acylneuraminate cytidylyltransferase
LIAYSIDVARRSKYISEVYVSTDCPEIARVAEEYGAKVPFMRPAELASDTAPEYLSWKHALNFSADNGFGSDVFVVLPTTSPLRTVNDVDDCIEHFLNSKCSDVAIAISKSNQHPSFNMVFRDENGRVELVLPLKQKIARRQDATPVYNITTAVYVTTPQYVLSTNSYFDGKVTSIVIPEEHGVDIDTGIDFMLAELLLKETK